MKDRPDSSISNQSPRSGQSLVEFVMVMPLLILLLLGSFAVGLGMYQGASASLAIKEAFNQKNNIADEPGMAMNRVQTAILNARPGNLDVNATVDTIFPETASTSTLTTVLVANRRFTPPVPFLPAVDFTVTQGIPTRLLSGNNTDVIPNLQPPGPVSTAGIPAGSVVPCTAGALPPTLTTYNSSIATVYGGTACPTGAAASSRTIPPANNIQY